MAASSFLLPSFSPQTSTISSKPQAIASTFPLSFTSSKPLAAIRNLSFPANTSFSLSRKATSSLTSVPKVAVASEWEQEEEEEEEEEGDFSENLKLFVGNLPFTVDSSQLAGLFQRAGNVEMVEVIYDKLTGRSRGFAFVTMSTEEEAEAAAQQFNGYTLEGRSLKVNSGPPPPRNNEFPPRRSQSSGNYDSAPSRRFQSSGSNYDSAPSRRSNYDSAPSKRFQSSGSNYDSTPSRRFQSSGNNYDSAPPRRFQSSGNSDSSNRVHVGNLSWGVDNLALQTLFSEQGNVIDAKVIYDRESGRSKGFGFVTYSSAKEVDNAISSLDGADMDGRSIRVSAAEPRQKREF